MVRRHELIGFGDGDLLHYPAHSGVNTLLHPGQRMRLPRGVAYSDQLNLAPDERDDAVNKQNDVNDNENHGAALEIRGYTKDMIVTRDQQG
jgi:hypothetical protein